MKLYIFYLLLFIINYYHLIQIQATFGFKVCLCAAALQLSSCIPMNKKTIKYSITGAKKCKTESSRKWVGLDQSRPVSQQILTTSLPKALTTLAFQTSRTSVQLMVRWELGSMKLNTPNLSIQQHIMVWTKENLVPSRHASIKSTHGRLWEKPGEAVMLFLCWASQVKGSFDHKLNQTDPSSRFYHGP